MQAGDMFTKVSIPNVTLPNNFLWVVEDMWRSFPSLVLQTSDSSYLLILLSYTIHKDNKMKSWIDLTIYFLEGELIKWQWVVRQKTYK